LKSAPHQKVMNLLLDEHVAIAHFMREHAKFVEIRRQINSNGKSSYFCKLCQVKSGNQSGHTKSREHRNLKEFLFPNCRACNKEFTDRESFDKHKTTVEHMKALVAKEQTTAAKDYMDEIDLRLDSLGERTKETRPSQEASKEQFTLSKKIRAYELPEYNENVAIGMLHDLRFMMVPVHAFSMFFRSFLREGNS
jgi:hypothetical protein